MTNPCNCKAEHWQPHADTCPAKPRKREYVSFQAQLEGVAAMGSAASHLVLQSLVAQAANVVEALMTRNEQLRGNLSLAEEGLANATQEIEGLKTDRDLWREQAASVQRLATQEIGDLRALLQPLICLCQQISNKPSAHGEQCPYRTLTEGGK